MFFDISADGQELRRGALPLIAQQPARVPDTIFSGPELPADESIRRRFFGDDVL